MPSINWSDCLTHVEVSDVGMRRANNQDSMAVMIADDADTWQRRGHVFVVADGMGAHAAGELASKMAADGIPHNYHKQGDEAAPAAIFNSVREINQQIHRRGQANAEFHGMGTTASVLILLPQGALVAHVGDSRVYRVRAAKLEQLTFDHSLVWEMAASGQLGKDAPAAVVPKNIITRSLGPHSDVKVDLEGPYPLEVGDTFLLCSDGLTGQVKDEEIGAILTAMPPAEAAQVLIDLANLRGGPDNITILIIKVVGPAITNQNGQAPPLAVARDNRAKETKSSNWVWIAAVVALLAAVGLSQVHWALAALALVVAGVLATMGVLRSLGPEEQIQYLAPGAKLGRGPYVTVECAPNATIVGNLMQLVDQLREAAGDGQWQVDWTKFNQYRQNAGLAHDRRDYSQAIRELVHALRFMMNQLKNQGRRRGSDDDLPI